jgi:hypothetical protein
MRSTGAPPPLEYPARRKGVQRSLTVPLAENVMPAAPIDAGSVPGILPPQRDVHVVGDALLP